MKYENEWPFENERNRTSNFANLCYYTYDVISNFTAIDPTLISFVNNVHVIQTHISVKIIKIPSTPVIEPEVKTRFVKSTF